MNAPSILPARFDRPSLIGNFLLNFGTLERSVFVFLRDHLPENEYVKVREWHLNNLLEGIVAANRALFVAGEAPISLDRNIKPSTT